MNKQRTLECNGEVFVELTKAGGGTYWLPESHLERRAMNPSKLRSAVAAIRWAVAKPSDLFAELSEDQLMRMAQDVDVLLELVSRGMQFLPQIHIPVIPILPCPHYTALLVAFPLALPGMGSVEGRC